MSDSRPTYELLEGFKAKQRIVEAEMELARSVSHSGQKGDGTEEAWEAVLAEFLPRRYAVKRSQIIISSDGQCSEQIDIVIYDPQYAPSFLKIDPSDVIPSESVYAVFEAKQDLSKKNVRAAAKKAASVRQLSRHPGKFRVGTESLSPDPGQIIAGILCTRSSWNPAFGSSFDRVMTDQDDLSRLDLGCVLDSGAFERTTDGADGSAKTSPQQLAIGAFYMALFRRLQEFGTAAAIDPERYGRRLWNSE